MSNLPQKGGNCPKSILKGVYKAPHRGRPVRRRGASLALRIEGILEVMVGNPGPLDSQAGYPVVDQPAVYFPSPGVQDDGLGGHPGVQTLGNGELGIPVEREKDMVFLYKGVHLTGGVSFTGNDPEKMRLGAVFLV